MVFVRNGFGARPMGGLRPPVINTGPRIQNNTTIFNGAPAMGGMPMMPAAPMMPAYGAPMMPRGMQQGDDKFNKFLMGMTKSLLAKCMSDKAKPKKKKKKRKSLFKRIANAVTAPLKPFSKAQFNPAGEWKKVIS